MIQQINYDLRKPGRDYSSLYAAIKSCGSWVHPLESCWLVRTNLNAAEVRDRLVAHVDQNDGLLITRCTGEAAWYRLDPRVEKWLAEAMPFAA